MLVVSAQYLEAIRMFIKLFPRTSKGFLLASVLTLPVFLAGCPAGNNLTQAPTSNPGIPAVSRAVTTIGPVSQISGGSGTGFSLVVNGTPYLVSSSTQITVNHKTATFSALKPGDIVTVRSSASSSSSSRDADAIDSNAEVQGPIASIDTATNVLVVLGQTVHITNTTLFDKSITGQALSGLKVGDSIEISGQFQANGSIVATRIESATPGQYEVTGTVSNENSASFTFNINPLVVDYSRATTIQGFSSGAPANGDLVDVQGTTLNSGTLEATQLSNATNAASQNNKQGDDVNVEGVISKFVSITHFTVAGQAITTNSSTSYENGSSTDLAANVQIQVEGQLDANGVLVAQQIEFHSQPKVEISASVDSVNTTHNTLVVLGLTVHTNASTRMVDDSSTDLQSFTLADLQTGDYVDISSTQDSAGTLTAVKLERENAHTTVQLDATVDSVSNPNFTMLGLTVSTDSNTQFVGTSATNFFSTAKGKQVNVHGTMNGTGLTASKVEFDN